MHSHCHATITNIHLHNFFIILIEMKNGNENPLGCCFAFGVVVGRGGGLVGSAKVSCLKLRTH